MDIKKIKFNTTIKLKIMMKIKIRKFFKMIKRLIVLCF